VIGGGSFSLFRDFSGFADQIAGWWPALACRPRLFDIVSRRRRQPLTSSCRPFSSSLLLFS
jgi:hypothetical protein